jgi:hypothetical protein
LPAALNYPLLVWPFWAFHLRRVQLLEGLDLCQGEKYIARLKYDNITKKHDNVAKKYNAKAKIATLKH